MIYTIKFHINIKSEKKNEFIIDELIPFCRSYLKESYYFSRNIEVGPVINLYIETNKEKIVYYYNIILKRFNEFLMLLSDSDIESNEVYYQQEASIRRVNGLRKQAQKENLTVEFHELETIARNGEYTYQEEKSLFTKYFMKVQSTMEDSFLYMQDKGSIHEMIMLVCMFQVVSQQLDKTGIGRGYLSFKSHLIGFLSNKRKGVDEYGKLFELHYQKLNDPIRLLREITNHAINTEIEIHNDKCIELMIRWNHYFAQLYEELIRIQQLKEPRSFYMNMRKFINYYNFRKISAFHKEVFAKNNMDFFNSYEFRAYRMLVNFTYLLLPNMGLNSRKRVEASYMLVKSIEEDE